MYNKSVVYFLFIPAVPQAMYTKLCTTLRRSFEKQLQQLDRMSLTDYMQKIEELKEFDDVNNAEDNSKEKQNILTPRVQKQRQYRAIDSMLRQSGTYVTSAQEDKADKVGWFGRGYKYQEIKNALERTNVAVYNKQVKDKAYESCISHGGYTLMQREIGQGSWVADKFFKVKDKSGNIRIIQRVPFFPRMYKNQKKAIAHLNEQVKREFLDSTGRIKGLTDLGIIPKVHDYFVCFSEIYSANAPHIYIVQDFVQNAMSLADYIKLNKDNLNKDALTQIMNKIQRIVEDVYTKTDYRYKRSYMHYRDFMCSLGSDKKTIEKLYLKNANNLVHKDVEAQQFEDEKKEREEQQQKLLDEMQSMLTHTIQQSESKQMDVAIMMMVQDNVLGLPPCDKDIKVRRIVDVKTRKSKVSSRTSAKKANKVAKK